MQRVCEVCASVGPEHVQLEGSRLLAATTKHCHDSGELLMGKIENFENIIVYPTLQQHSYTLLWLVGTLYTYVWQIVS